MSDRGGSAGSVMLAGARVRTHLSRDTSPSIITRKNPKSLSLNNHEQIIECVFETEK